MVELPNSVLCLSNLQSLDLNNCKLLFIPDSISGLTSLRFLSLSFNPIKELPASILTLSNLETLDVNTCKNLEALPDNIAGLSNLRIFDCKTCPLLKALPEDIGALTQLRYLNLWDTQIKVLPESCANLHNLEFLHLFKCEIPKYVENWTKLRKLFYSPRRNPVILGVGKLILLEALVYSVPQKLTNEPECNVGIDELRNLDFLESLTIVNLQHVKDPVDAETSNLKGKQNLRCLELHWSHAELGMMWNEESCNFQTFKALRPPTCLRRLRVSNFMGGDFPEWMCAPSGLPNLEWLDLENCKGIQQLPSSIGKLPRLRYLDLKRTPLKSLDTGGFPSLIELGLIDMFLLEELSYSYPRLQYLRIIRCTSLTEIPSFPSLTKLVLVKIDHRLVCSVGSTQTSLTEIFLENVEDLIYFPVSILQNNRDLQILSIDKCSRFEAFGVNDDQNEDVVALLGSDIYRSSLTRLQLVDCPVLKQLPDLRWWRPSLNTLTIFNCPKVKEYLTYDLKSLSFLEELYVDYIQRELQQGDPSVVKECVNLMELQ